MLRDAVAHHRLLAGALALLVALPLASWHGSAQAAGPIGTLTRLEFEPAHPRFGDTFAAEARIEAVPDGELVDGTVTFDLAPTLGELWGDGPTPVDVEFDRLPAPGGVAHLDITLDTSWLPFLTEESDGFWLSAKAVPSDSQYADSQSDTYYVELSGSEPEPWVTTTTTTLSGPTTPRAGTPTTYVAAVYPASIAGTVQFTIDGQPVQSPVQVVAGTAELSHTFETGGTHQVSATFTPAAPWPYTGSADSMSVVVPEPTTTTVTAPTSATVGTPTVLTATVSPATAAGTVQFSVDGAPVGASVAVEAGTASLAHTFSDHGDARVRATFTPTDPLAYGSSSDASGLAVGVTGIETTIQVTGPGQVTAGELAEFTARVTPVGEPGEVTFRFEDKTVTTVAVDDTGTAVASHRFLAIKRSSVTATWQPTDTDSYPTATAPAHDVKVVAGTTAEEFGDFMAASLSGLSFTDIFSCGTGRSTSPFPPFPPVAGVYQLLFTVFDMIFGVIRTVIDFLTVTFRAVLCPQGPGGRAQVVRGSVDCPLTDAGLECPFDLAAFRSLTITGSLPVPADLAGESVEFESTLSQVDPDTGEPTPLATQPGTLDVPRRTVLAGRLAPARAGVTSVRRGETVAYRLRVRNTGVLAAEPVHTCVRVGKGSEIRRAKGADIRARRACWTLPRLAEGRSFVRKVVVAAPSKRGDLAVDAAVRPRKSQADPLRLRTLLPVR